MANFARLDQRRRRALPKRLSLPTVDLKDIKAIVDLMRKNDLSVFELEREGFRLKLQKGLGGQPVVVSPTPIAVPALAGVAPAAGGAATTAQSQPAQPAADSTPLRDIVSPMVGTFYRTPS